MSPFFAQTLLIVMGLGTSFQHSQTVVADLESNIRAKLTRAVNTDDLQAARKILSESKMIFDEYPHILASVKSLQMAKLLVRSGAKPNHPSKSIGLTPLEYAVSSAVQSDAPRGYATVSAILAVGGDVNTPRPEYRLSLMETAIDYQHHKKRPDILELLLKAGLDPNKRYGVHRPAEQRKFPIDGAAFNGRLDLMQVLLKHGARMSVTTFEGNTLLHVASLENKPGNREVVAFLLKKGMNREAKNKSGERAIDIAKRKKYGEMIALLSR